MSKRNGVTPDSNILDFPTVYDGVRGMQFVETIVLAGNDDEIKWHKWVE